VPAPGRYLKLSLEDLLDELASPEPLPGGGFVAAVTVGMAAGLVAMAARLSAEHWREARGASAQAEALRRRLMQLAQQNIEAYAGALAALADGGDGGKAEQEARDDLTARALDRAAEVPLQIGATALDVGALAANVAEQAEASLRPDVAVAASLAMAGARAAATLVEVNLGTTATDERIERARGFVKDASAALERTLALVG
jgi:formiminotetrahydrofolate cyclodeaminase